MATRFEIPDDPVALRMENDLLTLEVEHLRGRGGSGPATDAELEEVQSQLARAERHLAIERDRVEELSRARSDLRWLLERLDGSPAGLLLRRFAGFRTLVSRWSDE